MRLVIQRVSRADVTVDGCTKGSIGQGLMVLVGVENGDTQADADWLAAKTVALRVFDDENGVMNRSILDAGGDILAISQFTLCASTRRGNRPGYSRAAAPDVARPLYEYFCTLLDVAMGHHVQRGIFGADMKVGLVNDGPVTIIIDSHLRE